MCGRYYIDDETSKEIIKLVKQIDEKMRKECIETGLELKIPQLPSGDIHPAELAPVLSAGTGGMACELQRWGFPGFQSFGGKSGKQVIFNARSESALEKPTFRESILHRRAVIPAAWFYEWNKKKEKNIFFQKGHPVLFMAGCFKRYQNEERFVILTTEANSSMLPVHDRMPLILEKEEIPEWIYDSTKTEAFLHKKPGLLERRTEYEQMSFF